MDLAVFLSFRSWSIVTMRRCVGKQTPPDPNLELRDVVWSDESLDSVARHSRLSTAVFPRSLSFGLPFFGTSSKHSPSSPAELRALLTRVYHRTWTGSRWMFERTGAAWIRRLQACVAAQSGFFEQHRDGRASYSSKTQRKNTSSIRHLTSHGTLHRRRQHPPSRNGPSLILKWALGPFQLPNNPKIGSLARSF